MKNMLLLFVLFCSMTMLFGQTPSTLSLQGVLREATGAAAADGDYSMTFKIYSDLTGGTALWTETQTARVNNGVYSVQLGASTALNLNFDQQYYVGVTVGGSELSPRLVLTAAPYAMGLKGSSNIFGGGGSVGIGTTTPASGQKLHVVGNAYVSGILGVAQELNVTGNAGFNGITTIGSASASKELISYGSFSVKNSSTWGAGIKFFSNSGSGASTTDAYWIQRSPDNTSNKLNKLCFMVPRTADAPNGGYYFGDYEGQLMAIENGTGNVAVKGTISAADINLSGTKKVVTTPIEIIFASGSYVSAVSATNVYNSIPAGITVTRNNTGDYTITLPAEFDWSKASGLTVTPLNANGSNSPVMAMVNSWGGTSNTVRIFTRQVTNNAFVDHDFSFYFVYKK